MCGILLRACGTIQELLWSLKDAQAKVERLAENNRVLILELEEKRALIEKINALYRNIPALLQQQQHQHQRLPQC